MKFRLRNIIVLFAFALICAGSIGGSLYNRNSVKEAKADSSATQRLYLNALAAYNHSSDHWDNNAKTFIYLNNGSYKKECTWVSRCISYVDVPLSEIAKYSSVSFKRVSSSDTSSIWNYSSTYSYSNGILDKNLCILTGWSNTSYWCSPSDFYVKGKISSENKTWSDDGIAMSATYTDSNPIYELSATGVTLTNGDEFKLYIKSGNQFFAYGQIEYASGVSTYLSCTSNNSNINVTKDITVDIFFKPLCNEGYEYNYLANKKIYIQENSAVAASKFADTFISQTATICSDNGASDHKSELTNIWSTLTTKFNSLTTGAKSTFNTSEDTSTSIPNARARYVHIVTRYTSLTLWTGGPTVSRSSGANRSISAFTDNSYALLATTILALVISASIGSYLLLKKKKVQ